MAVNNDNRMCVSKRCRCFSYYVYGVIYLILLARLIHSFFFFSLCEPSRQKTTRPRPRPRHEIFPINQMNLLLKADLRQIPTATVHPLLFYASDMERILLYHLLASCLLRCHRMKDRWSIRVLL